MRKENIKRNAQVVIAGCLLWYVANMFIFTFVINLVVKNDYPAIILKIYWFSFSTIVGLLVGFFSVSRGWLLGGLTQIVIAFSFLIFFTDTFVSAEMQEIGQPEAIYRHFLAQAPLIILASIGGFLGEKLRLKNKLASAP